jgi:hypothetical protein
VADTSVGSQCKFIFNKELRRNVLVPKGTEVPFSEYVLSGIFQIDVHNFFMTYDGK